MSAPAQMVFLGFGKYARADRIYLLEPITGRERGNGSRTHVWIEGVSEPVVSSRSEDAILAELTEALDGTVRRPRRRGRAATEHPHLFD